MKVQVTLNDELVKRIDKYADTIGLSRSACCAYWIGQAVLSMDKSLDVLDKMGVDLAAAIDEQTKNGRSKYNSDK